MKALTLYQPWASLVVLGEKKIETRSWQTRYTGPLAIHASGTLSPGFYDICDSPPFRAALERLGLPVGRLPLAAVLGSALLVACVSTEELLDAGLSTQEQALGDYGPRRFGWIMQDACALPEPVLCRGHLWLWELPEDVLRKMHAHHRD